MLESNPMDRGVTITEAARLLRVHPQSLRDWIQYGRLKARRQGRRYLLGESLVAKWKAHQDRVLAWPRLVDVALRLAGNHHLDRLLIDFL